MAQDFEATADLNLPQASSHPHPLTFRVMRLCVSLPSRRPTLLFPQPFKDIQDKANVRTHVQKYDIDPQNQRRLSSGNMPTSPVFEPRFTSEQDTAELINFSLPDSQQNSEGSSNPLFPEMRSIEAEGMLGSIGSSIILPSKFGNIFGGESLRVLISLYNRGPYDVALVTPFLYLETPSNKKIPLNMIMETSKLERNTSVMVPQKPPLPSHDLLQNLKVSGSLSVNEGKVNSFPIPIFSTGSNYDVMLAQRLAEWGRYTLMCSAEYTDSMGETRLTRQYFRFTVEKSVRVSTNVTLLKPGRKIFLVEVSVVNLMSSPLRFTQSEFKPMEGYECLSVTNYGDSENDDTSINQNLPAQENNDQFRSIFNSALAPSTGPGDLKKFSFLVIQSSLENLIDFQGDYGQDRTFQMGAVSLRWRCVGTGEEGYLENAANVFAPKQKMNEINIEIVVVPASVYVQQAFGCSLKVSNNTQHPKKIYLQVRRDLVQEIVPVGLSGLSLPELKPMSSKYVNLTFLPLSRGFSRK